MRSVDTNVVLRLILNDDPAQAAIALRLIAERTFISIGVLIECTWVLRSTYRLPRAAIADALETVLDIATVHTPDDAGVRWAIDRYRHHGADLPDMLHVVAAKGTTRFASFEKDLPKHAGSETPVPIECPA